MIHKLYDATARSQVSVSLFNLSLSETYAPSGASSVFTRNHPSRQLESIIHHFSLLYIYLYPPIPISYHISSRQATTTSRPLISCRSLDNPSPCNPHPTLTLSRPSSRRPSTTTCLKSTSPSTRAPTSPRFSRLENDKGFPGPARTVENGEYPLASLLRVPSRITADNIRKIKCGGGALCSNCNKAGKPCVYVAVPDDVNKATREKKAASKAARAQHAPAPSYAPYPTATAYPTSYDHLTVAPTPGPGPTRNKIDHRRTNSAPIFGHNGQQQQGFMPPNTYDAVPQGQDWQYHMNQYTPSPSIGYGGSCTQPMHNYQTMQSPATWTNEQMPMDGGLNQMTASRSFPNNLDIMSTCMSIPEETGQMTNSLSIPDNHNQMNQMTNSLSSLSIPEALDLMGSSSSNIHDYGWNMYTPSNGHLPLSADSSASATLSSGPTLSSPNTPYYGQEMAPTYAPLIYGEPQDMSTNMAEYNAPEYQAPPPPKNGLVGLGISQQPQPDPSRDHPTLEPPFYFGT